MHDPDAGAAGGHRDQRRGVGVAQHEYDVGAVRVEVGVGMGQQLSDPLALVALQQPRGVGRAAELGEQVGIEQRVAVLAGGDATDLVPGRAQRRDDGRPA